MDRRKFLKFLLAIPGLAVLPKLVNPEPPIPVQWPQTPLSDELKEDVIVRAKFDNLDGPIETRQYNRRDLAVATKEATAAFEKLAETAKKVAPILNKHI